jgi:hypothetical protein
LHLRPSGYAPGEQLLLHPAANDAGDAIARICVGGRLTVRTPHLAVPPVFKTGCRPLQRNLPISWTSRVRFERATSAFGRWRSHPLSYETMLGLELRVPIEVVHPAVVQIAGWKRALGSWQLIERRLLRWTPWLDARRVALARVARDAGRDDVGPRRRTRNDVLERQRRRGRHLAAILAREPVAQEHVEAREGNASCSFLIPAQRDHGRQPKPGRWVACPGVVLSHDRDALTEDGMNRILLRQQR